MKTFLLPLVLGVLLIISVGVNAATVAVGPSAYLQTSDGPWNGQPFNYFYLEDHEDGLQNTPGATASVGYATNISQADSVDGDDGSVDQLCSGCYSWVVSAGAADGVVFSYSFDEAQLGDVLPNHVGIAVTNAFAVDISMEGFDKDGLSIGTFLMSLAATSLSSELSPAQFIGLQGDVGLSSVSYTFDFVDALSTIEIDHFQYGDATIVPVPAAVWLFGSALGLLGWMRRKTA